MPVMRSLWPGIYGNATGSTLMVSNMRKRATQASRFMVQMVQAPLYSEETAPANENDNENHIDSAEPSSEYETGEEGLAICIAAEVFIHSFLFSALMLSLTNITYTKLLLVFLFCLMQWKFLWVVCQGGQLPCKEDSCGESICFCTV